MTKIYYNSRSQKNKKSGVLNIYHTQDPFIKKTIFIFIAITIATYVLIKVYLTFENHAQSLPQAELTITSSPQIQTAAIGDTVTYEVDENSCDTPVNYTQLHVTYPQDQLQLQKIDTASSAFNTEEETLGQSGLIQVSRSSDKPLSGNQQIAKLVFTVLQQPQTSPISVNNTVIYLNSDKKNVLSKIVVDNNTIYNSPEANTSGSVNVFVNCQTTQKNDTSVLDFLQTKLQVLLKLIK